MIIQRRDFLKTIAVSSTGVLLSDYASADTTTKPEYTSAVGNKFNADGSVKSFAGNTIICHVPQQGEHAGYFGSLLDVYREAQTFDFMRKITLLPPSSYHMTVFEGANQKDRTPGLWPEGVPLDAAMEVCDQIVLDKLRTFKLDCELPFRMKIDPTQLTTFKSAATLKLVPLDDAENAKIRTVRARLSKHLGISAPGQETYGFHTTLGYQIRRFDTEEAKAFEIEWKRWVNDIAQKSPIIYLGAPEYCTFKDMYAFNRQTFLT
ncbi:DUF1868 domain-containing protein [Phyllobacterium myrsinacearum]|uniref:DUF1868 domain-containing protein n=1 Tax=Phyllobacterium myrsinacearum TaxID=28101 RepID=A0A839EGH7_9HYPH|nr:DUF1868 domain-containing protein [Phyllobacterium myrsinacearum]MBA8879313.1 hypothetical protein [Phyllobacterium myrsinacearum]